MRYSVAKIVKYLLPTNLLGVFVAFYCVFLRQYGVFSCDLLEIIVEKVFHLIEFILQVIYSILQLVILI